MPKVYLLSRTLDPILGIFTGLFAYHLSESNPRSNIPQGHTLRELIPWQWNVWREERRAKDLLGNGNGQIGAGMGAGAGVVGVGQEVDSEWERLRKELEGSQTKAT